MSEARQIVCPSCGAINRAPADKPAEKATCGKCHTLLFPGEPVNLAGPLFQRYIQKSNVPVLVDFWADWCGPCRQMAPEFAKAAKLLDPEVRLAKLDTEQAPDIIQGYGIRGIPALILFKEGQEIARQAGVMADDDIVEWVRSYL